MSTDLLIKTHTCLYEGCSSIRSLGTGHFGLGFSGRAIVSGLCISYKLPQPGYVHFVLSIETQSWHNRWRHGVMRGRRHHSLHLHNSLNDDEDMDDGGDTRNIETQILPDTMTTIQETVSYGAILSRSRI